MSMHDNTSNKRRGRKRRSAAYILIPASAFVLGVAGAAVVSRSKSEPYHGVYRQEVVSVSAESSGRIASLDSPHGVEVRPGDPLMTIENGNSAAKLKTLANDRARLQRDLDEATAKAAVELAIRNDSVEKERLETRLRYADLLRTRLDVQLRRKALETGEDAGDSIAGNAAGTVMLASTQPRGSFRRLELADVANHEEVLNTQIALCEDRLAELDRLQSSLRESIERAHRIGGIKGELAAVTSELSALENAADSYKIASPAYGRVGVYRRHVGDFASAGETLVEVFDAERPYVLLTIPVADMAELAAGRHVRVAFEGIKTRKPLEGVVAEVISDAERDADIAAGPGAATAKVRVTPVGRLWPTPPAGATAFVQPLP